MARLTAAKRKKLPKSTFGEPGKRAYPMPDRSHAANAKARATQAVKSGRMSKAEEAKIDAKANRVLGKGHAGSKHSAENGHGRSEKMMKTRPAHERHAHAKHHTTKAAHKMEHHGRHHESASRKREERKEEHKPKIKAEHRREERHERAEHKKGEHKHVHIHHHVHHE